jgi:hypothetical protein
MSDGGIDLSAARAKRDAAAEPDQDSTHPADEGPFCPFSWMLGHNQNPITKQVTPMPFMNTCLKEKCGIFNAASGQCGILTIAKSASVQAIATLAEHGQDPEKHL